MTHDDWRTVRVTSADSVAHGVLELRLCDARGADLPEWDPGAHLEVETPAGIRQYSLCGHPGDQFTIAILREDDGRGGSKDLHDNAQLGTELRVRGPRNHFALVDDADEYVLIAGGIGITPLKAMAQHLAASGRPWRLHYGGRSAASMAYARELRELDPEAVQIHPQDTHGILNLDEILADADSGTVIYCCGPSGLLEAATSAVEASPARELHIERFSSSTTSADVDDDAETGEDRFVVELATTGGEVEVGPDQTILEAVRDIRPDVLSSCEEGYCGTCETTVIDGIPLHRDSVLTPSEQDSNETMMICVGRSCSKRLVLDL